MPHNTKDTIPIHLTQDDLDSLRELIALTPSLVSIVEMLTKMEGAFVIFIKLGNGVKWLTSILAPVGAFYYLVFHRDTSIFKALFGMDK